MDWSVDLFKGRSLKMNEKLTAALKNISLILDVSVVYAAIFERYKKHKGRKDESSHNHNHERSYIHERERQREKEIEVTRTYTNVEAHDEAHVR